jgi:hypothetical protein
MPLGYKEHFPLLIKIHYNEFPPHMQCERLIKMIKSWYVSVREETMAPARMVSFMEQHTATCEVCLGDPALKDEIAKIVEIVLPESKIPKAIRQQNSLDDDGDSDLDDEALLENGEDDDILVDDEHEDELEEPEPEEDEFLEDGEDD